MRVSKKFKTTKIELPKRKREKKKGNYIYQSQTMYDNFQPSKGVTLITEGRREKRENRDNRE